MRTDEEIRNSIREELKNIVRHVNSSKNGVSDEKLGDIVDGWLEKNKDNLNISTMDYVNEMIKTLSDSTDLKFEELGNRINDIPSGGVTGEQIANAVNDYLEDNPISSTDSNWKNKNLLVLGDSIVQGVGTDSWTSKCWASQLNKLIGFANVDNIAVGGAKATNTSDGNNLFAQINKFDSLEVIPDIIIVSAGANDFARGVEMGDLYVDSEYSPHDAVDARLHSKVINYSTVKNGKFKPQLAYVLNYIMMKFPNATLFVCTPMKSAGYGNDGTTGNEIRKYSYYAGVKNGYDAPNLWEYRNAIVEVANELSVPVIDMYSESQLDASNPYLAYACYSETDYIHPSENGYKEMAKCIKNRIEQFEPRQQYTFPEPEVPKPSLSETTVNISDTQTATVTLSGASANYNVRYLIEPQDDSIKVDTKVFQAIKGKSYSVDFIISTERKTSLSTNVIVKDLNGFNDDLIIVVKVEESTRATLQSITATKDITSYAKGTSVSTDDITVTANYSDGTSHIVNNSLCTFGSVDTSTTGTKSLTVTYEDKSTTIEITVIDEVTKTLESITASKIITKYNVGDDVDYSDITVKATYNTGEVETLNEGDYTVSEIDTSSEGTKTITISYGEKTATIDVEISEKSTFDDNLLVMPVEEALKCDVTDLSNFHVNYSVYTKYMNGETVPEDIWNAINTEGATVDSIVGSGLLITPYENRCTFKHFIKLEKGHTYSWYGGGNSTYTFMLVGDASGGTVVRHAGGKTNYTPTHDIEYLTWFNSAGISANNGYFKVD